MRALEPGLARIVAGGGLSRSDYLCGCIADLTGLVVERSSLREATATGPVYFREAIEWQTQKLRKAPAGDAPASSDGAAS